MKFLSINKVIRTACAFSLIFLAGCGLPGKKNNTEMKDSLIKGSYAADLAFFKKNNIEVLELKDDNSDASVLVVPEYQGRVMTSSSAGPEGLSYGWINYSFIEAGIKNSQFNPFGGEERMWLGPEGGPYSIYFRQGDEQVYANWHVPTELDTEAFDIVDQAKDRITFHKNFDLTNASGSPMHIGIDRKVKILPRNEIENRLGIILDSKLSTAAYETTNVLTNTGESEWTKETGALSIWLLSMFNTGENSVVFIPYQSGSQSELGKIVTDDYFGKVPADRLDVKENVIFFKTDGKRRSKIGLSPERALQICGSYDSDKHLLTVLWYSKPENSDAYVNSKWGPQENPFKGDVLNSYNDGPLEDGSIMGPFYEIESSSPAAFLKAGQNITHVQRIFHFEGTESKLNEITKALFDLTINDINSAF